MFLMRLMGRVGEWFDQRLQLGRPIREVMQHPVPRQTASWWYVFGSAALTIFMFQVVTGILLALVYVPSAGEAWNSLQTLNHQITLGWFIRALHGWGSNFMLAIVIIHMVQVFLFGAYKFPRELTWIFGVFLLLFTFGMAFTGQVLRFDQDAYWGLGIGASISSPIPVLLHARSLLALLALVASPILLLFRRLQSPTLSSSGSMPCFPSCRRRLRHQSCSSDHSSALPSFCCYLSLPVKARRVGSGDRLPLL